MKIQSIARRFRCDRVACHAGPPPARTGPFPSLATAFSLLLTLFALGGSTAHAWGPHGEIVQAALATLGPDDPLKTALGTNANHIVKYVWMADWRGQLQVGRTETFYTDDYLLFPTVTNHSSHICPEVRQTYAPHFHRALQALRTESPREAARWIGSLLHFVTDTGSPPHALGIQGPVHSKMENWLDAKLILLPGYQPRLLGSNDSSGETGLLQRMDGLIEYSKECALRCRADVMADRRPPVEPIVLECALETARVVADLLHTLGTLAQSQTQGASLTGLVIRPQVQSPELTKVPAKVILLGTKFSTLTDPNGAFAFHHLPAGKYEVVVSGPGWVTEAKPVNLPPNGPANLGTINLSESGGGNLLRNPRFQLRWVAPNQADGWMQTWRPGRPVSATGPKDWDGEWIPLENGVTYQLAAHWKTSDPEDPHRSVALRTKGRTNDSPTVTHTAAATPTNRLVTITGSDGLAWAAVSVRGLQPPWELLESVSFKPVSRPAEKPAPSAPAPKPAASKTTAPKPPARSSAATESDPRLHADGAGWRLDQATRIDPKRPRVLLMGDSILNGYLADTVKALEGQAYIDAWVNPLAQSSYRLHEMLAEVLARGPYDIVHVNMGLHGWQKGRIPDGQFEPLTRKLVETIRARAPSATFIWASSTPVTTKGKPGELDAEINPVIIEHNRLAAKVMAEMKVPVNDLYTVLAARLDLARGDQFHWKPEGTALLKDAVVATLQRELKARTGAR